MLVHAGAGGVGLLLTQLAVARGGRVITTVSTAEKEVLSREAGASAVIRYDQLGDLTAELPPLVIEAASGVVGGSAKEHGVEALKIEVGHLAARAAEQHEDAPTPKAGERGVKGRLPDAVVHRRDAVLLRRREVDL